MQTSHAYALQEAQSLDAAMLRDVQYFLAHWFAEARASRESQTPSPITAGLTDANTSSPAPASATAPVSNRDFSTAIAALERFTKLRALQFALQEKIDAKLEDEAFDALEAESQFQDQSARESNPQTKSGADSDIECDNDDDSGDDDAADNADAENDDDKSISNRARSAGAIKRPAADVIDRDDAFL